MISNMKREKQIELRTLYQKEYQDLIKEHGIQPIPCGPYALLRIIDFTKTHEGLIELVDDGRENAAMRCGMVIDFGSIALKGYEGTKGPKDWGIKVGDFVEYDRHEGRMSSYPQFAEIYRVINASDLYTVYKELTNE